MTPVVFIGVGAVVLGLAVAWAIVWRDLGATTGLTTWRRVWLASTIGSGVLALALKLAIIEGFIVVGLPEPSRLITVASAPTAVAWGPRWDALPRVVPSPPDNATEPAKAALGEELFHDPSLSPDGTVACASCHDVRTGAGADGRSTAQGIRGQIGTRNTPTVFNAAFQARQFWDGRAKSLEEQALGPLVNPIEMGNATTQDVVAQLQKSPHWVDQFQKVFGVNGLTPANLARTIAAYERTLVTPDAPYDRFVSGDPSALTPQQMRGMELFQRLGCSQCHAGAGFSRASLLAPEKGASAFRPFPVHANALAEKYGLTKDRGAALRGGQQGVWRVPSLRNVALTGPYFHNGAVFSLEEAIRVMAVSQLGLAISEIPVTEPVAQWNAQTRQFGRRVPGTIKEQDIQAIASFLRSLSSDKLAARFTSHAKSTTTISGGMPKRTGSMEQPNPPDTMR